MIRKRGRKGFCSAEFMIDGHTYQFTFNGKKGMPIITSKTEAREYENELKRQVTSGLSMKDSDLKNFTKFFNGIYMEYSRKHKVPLSTEFDQYYGKFLVEEFGRRTLSQISPRMIENYLSNCLRQIRSTADLILRSLCGGTTICSTRFTTWPSVSGSQTTILVAS